MELSKRSIEIKKLLPNGMGMGIFGLIELKLIEFDKEIEALKQCKFSIENMISFGNFIRENYHGIGTPKLISYNHVKYPHGTIEDIFIIWNKENSQKLK